MTSLKAWAEDACSISVDPLSEKLIFRNLVGDVVQWGRPVQSWSSQPPMDDISSVSLVNAESVI